MKEARNLRTYPLPLVLRRIRSAFTQKGVRTTRSEVSERIACQIAQAEKDGALFRPSREEIRAFRRRVGRGELVEPFPQLFGRSAYWANLERWERPFVIIKSLARHDDHLIFASFSAACVFGLPVSLELLEDVYLAVSPRSHTGKAGRFVRCGVRATPGIPTFARGTVHGIHVTSPEQTVVDCLCTAPFPQALAIADAALRLLGISRDELMQLVKRFGGRKRGVRGALRVASYVDARSQSGGESIARGVMIQEGFVVPDLQVAFPDVLEPWQTFYVDGAWLLDDGTKLVWEFDGKDKYTRFAGEHGDAVGRMMHERQRESRLTAVCDAVIRFDYRTVMTPGALARLLDAYGVPRIASSGS